MLRQVSTAYVLNQLAGMRFPEQGQAYDFMKRCLESPEHVEPAPNGPRYVRVFRLMTAVRVPGTPQFPFEPLPGVWETSYMTTSGKQAEEVKALFERPDVGIPCNIEPIYLQLQQDCPLCGINLDPAQHNHPELEETSR